MGDYIQQSEWVRDNIINSNHKKISVSKRTRVGFTTNMIKTAERENKTLIIIEPTNKILQSTMLDAREDAICTEPNETWCPRSSRNVLFEFNKKGNCDKCKLNIINNPNTEEHCSRSIFFSKLDKATCIGITYHKFQNIMHKLNDDEIDEDLKDDEKKLYDKILSADIILLDEYSNFLLNRSTKHLTYYEIKEFSNQILQMDLKTMKKSAKDKEIQKLIEIKRQDIKNLYSNKTNRTKQYIHNRKLAKERILNEIKELKSKLNKKTIRYNTDKDKNKTTIKLNITDHKQIEKLMICAKSLLKQVDARYDTVPPEFTGKINKKLPTETAEYLYNLRSNIPEEYHKTYKKLLIMLTQSIYAFNISNNEIHTTNKHFITDLSDILNNKYKGKFVLTGIALPDSKMFKDLVKLEFPDFKNTEAKQLVVVDKTHYNLINKYHEEEPKILEAIKILSDFKKHNSYVMCINRGIETKIQIASKDNEFNNIFFEHYRSDKTFGVEPEQKTRIMLCVGLPYTPQHSKVINELLDPEIFGDVYDSNEIRHLEMRQSFENAVGRIKDHEGQEKSIVFILGDTIDNVKSLFPDKKEIIEISSQNTMHNLIKFYVDMWFNNNIVSMGDIPALVHIQNEIADGKELNETLRSLSMHKKIQSETYFRNLYINEVIPEIIPKS